MATDDLGTLMGKRVAILTNGSRGDVQPFIALALHLQAKGCAIWISTNVNHVPFISKMGLDVHAISFDTEKELEEPEAREFIATNNPSLGLKREKAMQESRHRTFREDLSSQHEAIKKFGPDIILSGVLEGVKGGVLGHVLKVPDIGCNLQLLRPSAYIKTPLNEPCCSLLAWKLLIRGAFPHVKAALDLAKVVFNSAVDELLNYNADDYTYDVMHPFSPELIAVSPSLNPRPPDWGQNYDVCHIVGQWFIDEKKELELLEQQNESFGSDGALQELRRFLNAGEAPVFMGWGSLTAGSPELMARFAIRSLRLAGKRGIVLGGWAKLAASMMQGEADGQELEEYVEKSVLFVPSVPMEWLLKQCAMSVHHGGSGTTAAALRSGRPTIITPFVADQFDNAERVERSGCGVALPQYSRVSPEMLSKAILRCSDDVKMQKMCAKMRETQQQEDGVGVAAKWLNDYLATDVATGAWRKCREERIQKRQAREQNASRGRFGCLHFMGTVCSGKLAMQRSKEPSRDDARPV